MSLASLKTEFIEVPLGLIDEPRLPARSQMDEQKLDDLAADIRRNGLLQNLVLARVGDRFEVIAGHRRTLALKRAQIGFARALVYPSREDALEAAKHSENTKREELNVADEAIYFSELLDHRCNGDVDALCEMIGEKRSYVEGRLLLFSGDPEVFERLRAGEITIGVAHQLNKCTNDKYRRMLLHQATLGPVTVAVVSGWIQQWKQQEPFIGDALAPSADAPPPMPVAETNYFRCVICGSPENVHLMQPVNMHTHCRLAIFDPLMANARGGN